MEYGCTAASVEAEVKGLDSHSSAAVAGLEMPNGRTAVAAVVGQETLSGHTAAVDVEAEVQVKRTGRTAAVDEVRETLICCTPVEEPGSADRSRSLHDQDVEGSAGTMGESDRMVVVEELGARSTAADVVVPVDHIATAAAGHRRPKSVGGNLKH